MNLNGHPSMQQLFKSLLILSICTCISSCIGQTNHSIKTSIKEKTEAVVLDASDVLYYGIPESISSIDTSPGWDQQGQKILLTGIVYEIDGKTPAAGVLLYYYQTNTEGRYIHREEESRSMPPNERGHTHGYIRGWIKTDRDGKYAIYTVRPGSYPTDDEPEHVHISVKEPDYPGKYNIDDFVFDDDKLLTSSIRKRLKNRGGSRVIRMVQKDGLHIGERNIILGLNVPGYSGKLNTSELKSGKNIGEDIISFIPFHAWGPDKGSKTCPICKYGWYHGILYFVGNKPKWDEIKLWLGFLETESRKREKYLKVYFVYGNEIDFKKSNREMELAALGKELQLEKVALTFVPSFADSESEIDLNMLNPGVENTFLLYKRSRIIDKFINLKPSQKNYNLLVKSLDQSINEYFDLPKLLQK